MHRNSLFPCFGSLLLSSKSVFWLRVNGILSRLSSNESLLQEFHQHQSWLTIWFIGNIVKYSRFAWRLFLGVKLRNINRLLSVFEGQYVSETHLPKTSPFKTSSAMSRDVSSGNLPDTVRNYGNQLRFKLLNSAVWQNQHGWTARS